MNTNDLVLFHANCTDGFTAAWVAVRSLTACDTVGIATTRSYSHGDQLPDVTGYDNVYILDFCPSPGALRLMCSSVPGKVVVLDHHISAVRWVQNEFKLERDRPPNLTLVLDTSKSGAKLAEDFFPGEKNSPLVAYAQDRDLWEWKLPRSKSVSAYIESTPKDFANWECLNRAMGADLDRLADHGDAILSAQTQTIAAICKNKHHARMAGFTVPCVNSPVFQSEIGNELAKDAAFAVVWFMNSDCKYVYSLRSDSERHCEVADVSLIAADHGGGGHVHAAGFTSALPPIIVVEE